MALTNIHEILDRSIEERLYQVALTEGYTPDREIYDTQATYEAELQNIKDTKGFAIEIWGDGNSLSRELKRVPRIVYTNIFPVVGSTGNDFLAEYQLNGLTYDKIQRQPTTSDIRFEVCLFAKTAVESRVLQAIISTALPHRSYIPFYNDPSVVFLINFITPMFRPDLNAGIIEKAFTYEAVDIFETDGKTITAGISKIKSIHVFEDNLNRNGSSIIKVESPD